MPSTAKPKAKPRRRRRDADDDAGDSDSPASGSGVDSGSESDVASEASEASDVESEADTEAQVEPAAEPAVASAEPIDQVSFDEFTSQNVPAPQEPRKKTKKDKKQRGVETTGEPSKSTEDTTANEPAQPSRPRPASNRAAYLAKIAADPTFVPRVGKFWTHDERHYAAGRVGQGGSEYAGLREMSDYWRERRGRGRGGFGFAPRGGFVPRGRGRGVAVQGRSPAEKPHQTQEPGTEKLAAADADAPKESLAEQTSQDVDQPTTTESPAAADATLATTQPLTAPSKKMWNGETGRSDRGSWSHDGYAELAREEERRSAARERQQQMMMARGRGRGMVRGMFRGRGRGRSGIAAPQLGAMQPAEQTLPLSNPIAAKTQEQSGLEADPAATAAPVAEVDTARPVVKLPGSDSPAPLSIPTDETHPSNPPISDHEPSAITAHLQSQAEHAERLQQQELKRKQQSLEADMHRLEIGQQRVNSTGLALSDAGSQGSSIPHHPQPPPPNMLPPGIGVTETGAFFDIVTGQAVVWVPSPSPGPIHSPMSVGNGGSRMGYNPYAPSVPEMNMAYGYQQPPQAYYSGYPGSYGGYGRPVHPADSMGYAPYSPSYMSGRDSASPYPMQAYSAHVPPQLGDPTYFMPPRPQSKIEIRAPTSGNVSSRNQHPNSAEIAAATLKDPSKHVAGSPDSIGFSQEIPYAYQPMNEQYGQATRQSYYPQQYMPMGY